MYMTALAIFKAVFFMQFFAVTSVIIWDGREVRG